MVQLNLLPDLKREFLEAQSARNKVIGLTIIIMVVVIGLTALAGFYVYGVQNIQLGLVNSDIKTKTNDLKKVDNIDKYLTLQAQMSALGDLHAGKNTFSRLFDMLPVLNPSAPNSISLTGMQVADSQNTIIFTGITSDFQGLNTFKQSLITAQVSYVPAGGDSSSPTKENLFTNVTVQAAGLSKDQNQKDQVSFTIQVNYDKNAFLFSSTHVTASVPNTPSSQAPVFNGEN